MTTALIDAGRKGGSAPNHRWTDEERAIVRRDYAGTNESAQRIADKLGVSVYGVKGQVQKLGCARITDRKRWDAAQDNQLRELIQQHSVGQIAKKMKRSPNSVTVRSKRLGLCRRYRDGWYTKREACEILGVDHKWLQARIDSGALKAKWHSGHKPQKNGMSMWHIEEKHLRDFIRRYPEQLNGRNVDLVQVVSILAGLKQLSDGPMMAGMEE